MAEGRSFMGFGSLKTNLIAIVGFLLITAGSQIFLTFQAISDLRGLPETTNVYSNGRYLASRLLYLTSAALSTAGTDRQRVVEEAREMMGEMDERYRVLRAGDPATGVQAAEDARVLQQLDASERLWRRETKPFIDEVLNAPASEASRGLLPRIETDLIAQANEIRDTAQAFRTISEERVHYAYQLQIVFLGFYGFVALCVVLLSRKILSAVRESVASLSSGTSEILAGTSQQASGAKEQSAAVTQTLSTIEELLQSAHQVAERAKGVAASAELATEAGQHGRASVEASIRSMGAVRDQTELMAENVLGLAEQAQSIGEIIASVAEIAEQTNLLAINAGIEASRAGEHGPGFAVVAREIKDLAGEAKKSTSEIRQILGKIQNATSSAVMVVEEGTKRVNETIDTVNRAGDTIRSLGDAIAENARAAAQISAATNQQVTGITQIQQAMNDVNLATSQNVSASKQAEEVAQSLHLLGARLKVMLAG